MILKMKKFMFLVTEKEYERFLTDIRDLGVVHIEELQRGVTSDELQAGVAMSERYKAVLKQLDYARDAYEQTTSSVPQQPVSDNPLQLIERVEALQERENQLKHQLDDANKNIDLLEPWGNFNPSSFQPLQDAGYQPMFFVCSSKLFRKDWIDEFFATPVTEIDGKTYFVVNDYEALRGLFAELLAEIQRIKSEGDYAAGKALVDNYGTEIDPVLHKEVRERYEALQLKPYGGFVNPDIRPVLGEGGAIVDFEISYPDDYLGQMLEYGVRYRTL